VTAKRSLAVPAFAKINLLLRVVGVRADGHHELRTIFQSIALRDTVTIRPARGSFQLECDDPRCPADDTNLVWRAAERVWVASGRRGGPRGVAIHLAKRIPMQAGLGGGSSDAAAALVGLAKFWRVDAGPVHAVAGTLGADVAYFLEGGTALGLDRGDVLFPLVDISPFWVVLVLPGFGVSTRDAYSWWDEQSAPNALVAAGAPVRRWKGRPAPRPALNDLEPPVARHHPDILRIVAALGRHGATYAAMSGSGSAVFGLFERRRAAHGAAAALSKDQARGAGQGGRPPAILVTRTVGRSSYRRLVGIPAHRIDLPFAPRGVGHS
jgi:4-diphosphocytidyl-2-C-methyl-D-erythritol kinase